MDVMTALDSGHAGEFVSRNEVVYQAYLFRSFSYKDVIIFTFDMI
jgi:hypothetical protein